MTISPCVVIPCYNHGYAVERLISELSRFKIPMLIVNDGSTDGTAAEIERARERFPQLEIIHRPSNGGKGLAVCDGLRWARERGYTHAVLIDSDGQHATEDIPRLLASAASSPESIVLGSPRFGSDAPLSRRIGREISNIFVALVTARWAARDVLCGFRVYPIGVIFERLRLEELQPRMGFDSEILVRALWEGISVVNVPTHVTYPIDGVSHFRYGADNLQLARLYVRLAIVSVWMIPRRLIKERSSSRREGKHWFQIAERGSLAGLRLLLLVLEKVGRLPLLLLMGPIVLHMFVWGRTTRRAAIDFQSRMSALRGESVSRVRIYARALRQFWEFGVSVVEKVCSWREGVPLERFTWVGRDEVKARLARGQGVIFMSAHVGNVEVIRALGETRQVVINALMYTANARHFRSLLEQVNDQSFVRVVDISSLDPSMVLDLRTRLAQGEVVALLGDRAPESSVGRAIEVPFLGGIARFPEGPWILASLFEAPVYTVFSMREPGGRYHVEFSELANQIALSRESRGAALRGYISEFATRLGATVQRYPYQWFNFYPFWDDERRNEEPDLSAALPNKG